MLNEEYCLLTCSDGEEGGSHLSLEKDTRPVPILHLILSKSHECTSSIKYWLKIIYSWISWERRTCHAEVENVRHEMFRFSCFPLSSRHRTAIDAVSTFKFKFMFKYFSLYQRIPTDHSLRAENASGSLFDGMHRCLWSFAFATRVFNYQEYSNFTVQTQNLLIN